MRTLIVEDDFTSRLLLEEILKTYGSINTADNGREAVATVKDALDAGEPYDLICLDIMMPEMDGQEALRKIRDEEERRGITLSNGVKIVMTTALDDPKNVIAAYQNLCDTYIIKPIQKKMLLNALSKLGLVT
jgi:two-component system, chemotaxis family, chemotaxis protein CheY